MQGGKFDIADRLFFSVNETFRNAIEELTDVRELIPDFYCLPEMFINQQKHDFGIMQNNVRVHNVQVPNWAKQNPYCFVALYRKAFESEIVSKDL